ELGRAIGVQGAAQAIGLSVGPSVGGLLIGTLGWQWVFYIAVPFGLLGAVLAWFVLPQTEREAAEAEPAKERFDGSGAAIFTAAVALALLALTFGNSWGWASPSLIGCAALAAVAFVAFVQIE